MKTNDSTTESAILEAAKFIFIHKGYEGARMQEIADKAAINKALLHYYFRSKDKLFEAVFIDAFVKFVPTILITLNSNSPLFRKIEVFVDHYIDVLIKNPFIPGFILHELERNTERLSKIIRTVGLNPDMFVEQVQAEIAAGVIDPVDPRELLVNMLAMCIFPFVGKPILKVVLFKNNEEEYNQFLMRRKSAAAQFIINSIKKK